MTARARRRRRRRDGGQRAYEETRDYRRDTTTTAETDVHVHDAAAGGSRCGDAGSLAKRATGLLTDFRLCRWTTAAITGSRGRWTDGGPRARVSSMLAYA